MWYEFKTALRNRVDARVVEMIAIRDEKSKSVIFAYTMGKGVTPSLHSPLMDKYHDRMDDLALVGKQSGCLAQDTPTAATAAVRVMLQKWLREL